jgi:Fur family ferric uptake transcriptional regulator
MKNKDLADINNLSLHTSQSYKTKLRQVILDILQKVSSPISSLELYTQIQSHQLVCDRSTVYRQLDRLSREGLILQLDLLDGKKRYELKKQSHHHHLVCNFCKKAVCITIPEKRLEQLIITPIMENGFTVTSHVLEFFGVCKNCNKSRS